MTVGATVVEYAMNLARAGSSAALALSFGTTEVAANRVGLFADLTGAAEKLTVVVGGVTGPSCNRLGSAVQFAVPGNTIEQSILAGSFGIQSYATGNGWFGENTYYNGANFIYRANGDAGMVRWNSLAWQIQAAPAGVAGNTATFVTLGWNSSSVLTVGAAAAGSISMPCTTGTTLTSGGSAIFGSGAAGATSLIVNAATATIPSISLSINAAARSTMQATTVAIPWALTDPQNGPWTVMQYNAGAIGAGSVYFNGTLSASSSIAGAVRFGDGVAATSVAIGAGKINAGDTVTVPKISSSLTTSDVNASYNMDFVRTANTTASGAHNTRAISGRLNGTIAAGQTNSGEWSGLRVETLRNYISASDAGTLTSMTSASINVGHFNTDGSTPTTTTIRGLAVIQYRSTGTIGTMYGIHIDNATTTVTPTTGYGLRIENAIGTTAYAISTGTGLVQIGDTTDSISITTGAVQIAGGGYATKQWTARNFLATGGTITTNQPVFDSTQTWNAGGVGFTGIKLTVTDTASSASSYLIELASSGASAGYFRVDKTGQAISQFFAAATGTITANLPGFSASQTWNNGAVTFTAVKANVTDTASASGSLLLDLQTGGVTRAYVRKDGRAGHVLVTATTAAADDVLYLGNNSSGTPAAGYGVNVWTTLKSSTTADQGAAQLTTTWVVATHASRTARQVYSVYDTAARECLRLEASGSAPMIGFLGANAAARVTFAAWSGTATRTTFDTATATLVNVCQAVKAIVDDLRTFGLYG